MKPPIDPAMEIRLVRRVDQDDAAFGRKMGQGGPQQMEFAYSRLAGQEFDERTQRPPLPGKLAVQGIEAGGNDGAACRSKLGSSPESRMNVFGMLQGKSAHCGAGLLILYKYTVKIMAFLIKRLSHLAYNFRSFKQGQALRR